MQARDKELDADIGRRVAIARRRANMSKVDLARFLGRQDPGTSAQKYESGKSGLSPADLLKIAERLGVSLDWLIRGEQPKGTVIELSKEELDDVLRHYSASEDERQAFAEHRKLHAHAQVTSAYVSAFLFGRRSQHDDKRIARDATMATAREAAIAESGSAERAPAGELRRRKPKP